MSLSWYARYVERVQNLQADDQSGVSRLCMSVHRWLTVLLGDVTVPS